MNYLAVGIGVFGTLLGVGLGAWLNALLTTRRERWMLRRDMYFRLLEHLHEASALLDAWVRFPSTDRGPELSAAVEQIRRSTAVARLVLDPQASAAIDALETTWRSGREDDRGAPVLRQRIEALETTYRAVLQAARRDLGL